MSRNKNKTNMLQLNTSGLSKHKVVALNKYFDNNSTHIVALSETHRIVSDEEFPEYEIAQSCIEGGESLLIHKSLSCTEVLSLKSKEVDVAWCITYLERCPILVGSVYIPPNKEKQLEKFLKNLNEARKYCTVNKIDNLLVLGDYNARHTMWQDNKINKHGEILEDYVTSTQDICVAGPGVPTFLSVQGNSVIDLALISPNFEAKVTRRFTDDVVELFTGAPRRGHIPVLSTIDMQPPKKIFREKYDLSAEDWDDWKTKLEAKAEMALPLMGPQNAKEAWETTKQILKDVQSDTMRTKRSCIHSKPFWCKELTEASECLRRARRSYRMRSTPANEKIYKEKVGIFKNLLIEKSNSWTNARLDEINKSKNQNFWEKVSKVHKSEVTHGIAPLKAENGYLFENSQKAELLRQTFFTGKHLTQMKFDDKFYDKINKEVEQWSLQTHDDMHWCNDALTWQELNHAIKTLPTSNKAIDTDCIHPKMLKRSGPNFRELLLRLFNKCMEEKTWPWVTNKVIFMRKPGKSNYSSPSSYRPITISSYVGKLFERLLESRIRAFAEHEGILDNEQEGFRKQKSTVRLLYRLLLQCKNLKLKKQLGTLISLDLEKAFDSVWINGLLWKLNHIGITGNILGLIESFLRNRQLFVEIGEFQSEEFKTDIGVPQGAVLSPLLFIIFVSEMFNGIDADKFKFADDGNLLINASSTSELHQRTEAALLKFFQWCTKWRLKMNVDKTILVPINIDAALIKSHKIGDEAVKILDSCKILGVTFDSKMTFKTHANVMKGRALHHFQTMDKLVGQKWGLSPQTLIRLFNQVLIPKVLYAAPIWALRNLDTLNSAINKTVKQALGVPTSSSNSMTEIIAGTPPIALRCETITARFFKKVMQSNDDLRRCTLETPDKKVKQDIAIMKEFEKITHTERRAYSGADVAKYIEFKWNRRIKNSEHNALIPVQVKRVKISSIAMPMSCPLVMQKTIHKILLDRCIDLANFAYQCSLVPSPNCQCQNAEETSRHFLFECRRHSHLRTKKYMNPDIYDEEWIKELIQFVDATKILTP